MKTILILLSFVGLSFGLGFLELSASCTEGKEIDDEAWFGFALLRAQELGLNLKNQSFVVESLSKRNLTCKDSLVIISKIDVNITVAFHLISNVLPKMKKDGRSIQEQITALFFLSKTICGNSKKCSDDIDTLEPLLLFKEERGCEVNNSTGAKIDDCLCDDQSNPLFWINLYEQISGGYQYRNRSIPDQFPAAVALILSKATCQGKMKNAGKFCSCSRVTKGDTAIFLQYFITNEDFLDHLSDNDIRKLREAYGVPQQRQLFGSSTLNVQDYITSLLNQQLASLGNPFLSAILSNPGASTSDLLRQVILSSIGLDVNLLQVILNGGFGTDPDRVGFINYLAQIGVLDPGILPVLFSVPNAQQFFVSTLVDAGQIDPTLAVLLLGNSNGLSSSDTVDLLLSAISNRNNPDFLDSIARPYVPPLPEGIYPGSKLYFAHFETLNINTCAMHDLRNRFNCGYLGITAAACETVPYCCYNPVFITDEQVRNATDFQITSATAVPWCYYNIFFIYFKDFYLPVLRPGQFASPIQCSGLYKYGLQLDPNLISILGITSSTLSSLINQREDCGFPGITEFQCRAIRGCCWDENPPFRVPQCYKRNGNTGIAFTNETIPAAYRPVAGSCNLNPYKFESLYFLRTPCHYTLKFHDIGYNLLDIPNELDCLTKLGCCWERDEEVLNNYPYLPQCYQRAGGEDRPSIVPDFSTLTFRTGEDSRNGNIFYQTPFSEAYLVAKVSLWTNNYFWEDACAINQLSKLGFIDKEKFPPVTDSTSD